MKQFGTSPPQKRTLSSAQVRSYKSVLHASREKQGKGSRPGITTMLLYRWWLTLSVELAYKISGSGSEELVKINHVVCFPHGWKADRQQVEDSVLTIPKDAPISYRGMHIRVEWMICVYREYGWHKNLRQIFPIRVEPELVD